MTKKRKPYNTYTKEFKLEALSLMMSLTVKRAPLQ